MSLPAGHPVVAAERAGVLLVNLGTPDAPDARSVRRYLAQFLSDRRVVEIPQILWQPILRGVILTTRPKKSAHAYAQVWTEDGSPLAAITRAQTAALQSALGNDVKVAYAMRYGEPAIGRAIDALTAAGCRRILLAPLYPQYCAATTATVVDAAADHLKTLRWQPARYVTELVARFFESDGRDVYYLSHPKSQACLGVPGGPDGCSLASGR